MIALLLRVIFCTITTIWNLISRVIFCVLAEFLVLVFHTCRVPGEATKGLLEQVAEVIKSILTFIIELIVNILTSIMYKVLEAIKDAIIESVSSTSGSLVDLVEKTREPLLGFGSDIPEVFEGLAEMVTSVIYDFGKNYMEAMGYVWEKIG